METSGTTSDKWTAGDERTAGDKRTAGGFFSRLIFSRQRAVVPVIAVIALLLAFMLLLLVLLGWQSTRDARDAVEAQATSAVVVAATHAGWLIEANLQALRRIAEAMGARPDRLDGPRLADLGQTVAMLPGDVQIWLFDDQGRAVLSSEAQVPASVAHRQYFQDLRDGETWAVGAYQHDEVTGRRAFSIGRRLERNGAFVGAVISFVPVANLTDFWQSMDLGPGATVSLIRNDGWLVARTPPLAEPLNVFDHVLFTEHLQQRPEGTFGPTISPLDGTNRLVAYRRLDRLPLVATVAIPTTSLALNLGRRALELLVFLAPVGIALLGLAAWALILVRREERALQERDQEIERNVLLFREMHHRVKNNLHMVAALIRLQDGMSDSKHALTDRIGAMAAVHDHFHDLHHHDHVNFSAYVGSLCESMQAGYADVGTVHCDIDTMTVTADRATPLGLLINELVANAFRHGFVDGREGRVDIRLEVVDAETARLTVRDNGVGMGARTHPEGLGGQLITALARQLGGEYAFRHEDGTVFEMTFPRDGTKLKERFAA